MAPSITCARHRGLCCSQRARGWGSGSGSPATWLVLPDFTVEQTPGRGWKRQPHPGDSVRATCLHGNAAPPSRGRLLPSPHRPFSAPSLTILAHKCDLSGWGAASSRFSRSQSLHWGGGSTMKRCHGDAVTSEEPRRSERGGAGRQGQHFQDAQGTLKGAFRQQVNKLW